MKTSKSDRNGRKVRFKTNKILDRITYNPTQHKDKAKKLLRKTLQQRIQKPPPAVQAPPTTLTLGSINVNGLDLEAGWAVEQLLVTKDFDVSINKLISFS